MSESVKSRRAVFGIATGMADHAWFADGLLDRDRGVVDRGKPIRFKLKFRPVEGVGFLI